VTRGFRLAAGTGGRDVADFADAGGSLVEFIPAPHHRKFPVDTGSYRAILTSPGVEIVSCHSARRASSLSVCDEIITRSTSRPVARISRHVAQAELQ